MPHSRRSPRTRLGLQANVAYLVLAMLAAWLAVTAAVAVFAPGQPFENLKDIHSGVWPVLSGLASGVVGYWLGRNGHATTTPT